MELPRNKSLDFAQCRGVDVCEAVNLGVNSGAIGAGA